MKMKIRTFLLILPLISITIFLYVSLQKYIVFSDLAEHHKRKESMFLNMAATNHEFVHDYEKKFDAYKPRHSHISSQNISESEYESYVLIWNKNINDLNREADLFVNRAMHHKKMASKYENFKWKFWSSPEPDPPTEPIPIIDLPLPSPDDPF